MENIKIIYNDVEYEYPKGIKLIDIAKDFEKNYKNQILAAKVNGVMASLDTSVVVDSKVKFYDINRSNGNRVYERTAIFILCKAVKDVTGKELYVEHSIDRGIYCLVDGLTEEILSKINIRMQEIINNKEKIEKLNVNRLNMIKYFNDKGLKSNADLLKYVSNSTITIYKLGELYDYFYGEMYLDTSCITSYNLKYLSGNGFVMMLPTIYDNGVAKEYTHHEQFFNSVVDYIKWTNRIGARNFTDINSKLSLGKWNDLIFMSEATYNKSLLDIADIVSSKKDIKMVLIAGPSCSGKTTTSKKLEMFLEGKGLKPIALSVDDYFKERDETPLDENGFKDFESINSIDTDLFNKQITEMLEGEEVTIPTFNFITGCKEYKKKIKLSEDSILIIEGLHSLNDELTKSISNDRKYKIYISPLTGLNIDNHNRLNTTDNRLLRRMVRDNLRRGYNASATLESWGRVRDGETKYVFPYQDKADIVLNTSLIYEMSVLKVYAEPLLFSVSEDDPNYNEALRLINILRMILPMPSASIPLDSIMREFIGNGCFED